MMPTDVLRHEHKIVLLILEAAEREVRAIRESGRADRARLDQMLDFFLNFVGRCHHAKEELYLFPKMQERSPHAAGGPIAALTEEHEEGKRRLGAVEAALPDAEKGDREALAMVTDNLGLYVDLLRAHIDKEDNVMYPLAERILRPADRETLLAAFEKVEAEEMGEGVHEKYHHLAHELAEQK